MMRPHRRRETRALYMGVDLGGRNIGVAEHRLDRAQIGAAVEQVAGEGMAQHVRRDPGRVDAGGRRQLLEQLGEALAGQVAGCARATGTDRRRPFGAPGQEMVADREIGLERARGRRARSAPCAPCRPCRARSGSGGPGRARTAAAPPAPRPAGRSRTAARGRRPGAAPGRPSRSAAASISARISACSSSFGSGRRRRGPSTVWVGSSARAPSR